MLVQNLRGRIGSRLSGNSEAGFTLIELLVVMLILGILAAIAIPAFFNQKNKANDSQAKSYAHSAQVAMETWSTEHGGKYSPAPTAVQLKAIEPTLNGANISTVAAGEKNYTVTITSSTNNTFSIVRAAAGTFTYPCTIPSATADHGGCNVTAGTTGTWN
jgi:type IV pilus assembly protein PilA